MLLDSFLELRRELDLVPVAVDRTANESDDSSILGVGFLSGVKLT